MKAAGDVHVEEKAAICLCQNWPIMDQGRALSSLRGSDTVPSFDVKNRSLTMPAQRGESLAFCPDSLTTLSQCWARYD